ncbi:hypothetical protein KJ652_00925 [Patescibacteria group bacterium]|nr:hypothetical protein [Patescibacteria group bacterium]MBU1123133.1 hypothetical protein [Patescibacteria group bacterium]MBU1911220.1 hypothetical protein [Patescibacteria group bacterium]
MFILDLTLIFAIIFVILIVSTVIATIWASVPFVPTPRKTIDAMIKAAELKGDETVYDLGAGDGRMLIRVKKKYPNITAIGYEIVPLVWFMGWLRTFVSRSGVKLKFGNSFKADIGDADCILLYMITRLMALFAKKFDKELRPGTKVISHGFQFKDREYIKMIEVPGMLGMTRVYVYEW